MNQEKSSWDHASTETKSTIKLAEVMKSNYYYFLYEKRSLINKKKKKIPGNLIINRLKQLAVPKSFK